MKSEKYLQIQLVDRFWLHALFKWFIVLLSSVGQFHISWLSLEMALLLMRMDCWLILLIANQFGMFSGHEIFKLDLILKFLVHDVFHMNWIRRISNSRLQLIPISCGLEILGLNWGSNWDIGNFRISTSEYVLDAKFIQSNPPDAKRNLARSKSGLLFARKWPMIRFPPSALPLSSHPGGGGGRGFGIWNGARRAFKMFAPGHLFSSLRSTTQNAKQAMLSLINHWKSTNDENFW